MRRLSLLAVLAALTACGGPNRATPRTAAKNAPPAAAAAAPASPPRAEGRVQVDVVDEPGAAYGPAPSRWFERCHHAGSENVGWALFLVDRQYDLQVKLAESEGLSEDVLACAKTAIGAIDPGALGHPRFGLYVRFY